MSNCYTQKCTGIISMGNNCYLGETKTTVWFGLVEMF